MNERAAIGGELEIDRFALGGTRVDPRLTHGREGAWTASGRAALFLVLTELRRQGIREVQLPSFLCESLLSPVQRSGLEVRFYRIDRDLRAYPERRPQSAVLLIHYFGWPNPSTLELRGGAFPLIEDFTHSLLSGCGEPDMFFFSARKFAPTVLGGWSSVKGTLAPVDERGSSLFWRSTAARLVRAAYLAEGGGIDAAVERFYLEAYAELEAWLDSDPALAGAPDIAIQLLSSIDWDWVTEKRRANWKVLDAALDGGVARATPPLDDGIVPLGYLVRIENREAIRTALARQRIFCPVLWPLPAAVPAKDFPEAAELASQLMVLPIDQRYDASHMEHVAESLHRAQ
jgi:hypothetical protein